MTKDILKYFKVVGIGLFYFLFSSLFTFLLMFIFKIDINVLGTNQLIIVSFISELIVFISMYLFYRKSINSNFSDYKNNFKEYFKLGFKYWIIGLGLMVISNIIITSIYDFSATNEVMVESLIKKLPVYMFFSSVIFAPVTEEILFRKSIREIFTNDFLYILFSGLLFGFVHTLAGNTLEELIYIIPYSIPGMMFAKLYVDTDNILVPITFHSIHNFILVCITIASTFIGA